MGCVLFEFLPLSKAETFTVNLAFQLGIQMTMSDLQADSLVNQTCFKVHIKCSKTDPFHVGSVIYMGQTEGAVCHTRAQENYLSLQVSEGPLFTYGKGCLYLANSCRPQFCLVTWACTQTIVYV